MIGSWTRRLPKGPRSFQVHPPYKDVSSCPPRFSGTELIVIFSMESKKIGASSAFSFHHLPVEVLHKLVDGLSLLDVLSFSRVNKHLHRNFGILVPTLPKGSSDIAARMTVHAKEGSKWRLSYAPPQED